MTNLGSTGYGNRVIWLKLLAWGGGFWGPALLRGLLLRAELGLLGLSVSLASPAELLLASQCSWRETLPQTPSSAYSVRVAAWSMWEAIWHVKPQPSCLPPSHNTGWVCSTCLAQFPYGETSAFETVTFQVTVSSIRAKVTLSLQAADELATAILMICLWLSYWEFNFILFLPVDICSSRGRALHCMLWIQHYGYSSNM